MCPIAARIAAACSDPMTGIDARMRPSREVVTMPPISASSSAMCVCSSRSSWINCRCSRDRKSTRLNSSHTVISYAVFCLKKKKKKNHTHRHNNVDQLDDEGQELVNGVKVRDGHVKREEERIDQLQHSSESKNVIALGFQVRR